MPLSLIALPCHAAPAVEARAVSAILNAANSLPSYHSNLQFEPSICGGDFAVRGWATVAGGPTPISVWVPGEMAPGATQDETKAASIEQQAVNAQNANDFREAAKYWQQLLEQYPKSTRRGEALHNFGICLAKQANYDQAEKNLSEAIQVLDGLDPKPVQSLARAHLYLGYSQLEQGKSLADRPELAKAKFTTAAQTLGNLISRFPDYAGLPEGYYFQGVAYENLQLADKAEAAFAAACQNTESSFYPDSLFALGFAREQLGKYAEALVSYRSYMDLKTDLPARDEVRMRAAECLLQLAQAAGQRGDEAEKNQLQSQSLEMFQAVASNEASVQRDQALIRQGLLLFQQNQFGESGKKFEMASEIAGSTRASRARVLAGRAYLQADLGNDAFRVLDAGVKADDENSPESAHWLAQLYLRAGKPDLAAELAQQWLAKAANHPMAPELMMDQADAALAKPNNQAATVDLYLQIVQKFPDHVVAPTALYQAAFSLLEINEAQRAADLCQQFQNQYANHSLLPEVLELHADSHLVLQKYPAAVAVWQTMLSQYPQHSKQHAWSVRLGLSLFFAERFDEAVKVLEPLATQIADPVLRSEALHWLGASEFRLERWAAAAKNLAQSVTLNPTWKRTPETRLLLVQSQLANDEVSAAEQVVKQMIQDVPQTPQTPEAVFRVAQRLDRPAALEAMRLIETGYSDSTVWPFALVSIARLETAAENYDTANALYARVLDGFPNFPEYHRIVLEWSASMRQAGDAKDSLSRLAKYSSQFSADSPELFEIGHELALAEMAAGQVESALNRWERLLQHPQASRIADQILYELAWGYRDWANQVANDDANLIKQRKAKSVTYFQTLAEQFPEQTVSADAFYQLGQAVYETGNFENASSWFEQCLQSPHALPALKEKSLYKLGWCAYRRQDFATALKFFRTQQEQFPEGELIADSMFMQSESLFAQDNYRDALVAYRAAKPVIETSKHVAVENRWLNLLHGAQAAIQIDEYQQAKTFAQELIDLGDLPAVVRDEALLELGKAELGLKDRERARQAWAQAALDLGKTGAQARFLLGELLFSEQKFEDAVSEFKKVFYGYGGNQVDADVDVWQARAIFETARCYQVQIDGAKAELRIQHIKDAIFYFELLLKDYPSDSWARKAEEQLRILRQLQ